MRPRMREIEGQRGLRVGMAVALDAGRRAAERAPSVSADGEPRVDAVAAVEHDGDAGLAGLNRVSFVLDPGERRQCPRAGIQRREQMAVFDVVAEGVEADFGCREANLRRANEPPGGVDDPHDAERSRLCRAPRPNPKRLQRGHGTGQQRGGAMIGYRATRDQRGFDPGLGQCDCSGQPGRAAAHDRHLDG